MNLKKLIGRNKFRFQRGYGWIVVGGIPFLVAREMEKIIPVGWVYLLGLAILLTWLLGYLEDKNGLLEAEQEYAWKRNPEWNKMQEKKE